MTRRASLLAIPIGALLLSLTACGGEQGAASGETPDSTESTTAAPPDDGDAPWDAPVTDVEFPLTFTDGSGKEVTIDQPYTKVGCLYSGCEEVMADLGLVPNAVLAGGDEGPFARPAGQPAHEVEDELSAEEWARSSSDVIIDLAGPLGEDDARALKGVAPVVFMNAPYAVWNPDRVLEGVEAWKQDTWMMGQLTGEPQRAKDAIDRFETFASGLQALAPDDAASTSVANLSVEDNGVYSLMDPSGPFCDALTTYELGQCEQIDGWDADSWEINAEAFLAADPEWIAYTVYDDSQSHTQRSDPVWKRLGAVREDRVFDFSRSNCCGLRVLEHALQDYAFHVWGADSGVPDPGARGPVRPGGQPRPRGGPVTVASVVRADEPVAASPPDVTPPWRPWRLLAVLAGAMVVGLALIAWNITHGVPDLTLPDAWQALTGDGLDSASFVVQQLRVPRMVAALASGAALGVAGVILQDALRNPIADPSLLGISQSVALVAVILVMFPGALPEVAHPLLFMAAGLFTGGLLVAVSRSVRDPIRLIMIGFMLALFYGTITDIITLLGPQDAGNELAAFFRFQIGSLSGVTWDQLDSVWPWLVVTLPIAMLTGRSLNLLQLGDDVAAGLGMHVVRTRLVLLCVAVLLVTPAVSISGPIEFVALISPHVCRSLLGTTNAYVVLPAAAAVGGVTVLAADTLGRLLFFPLEVPAGLWTVVVIGPAAIWLAGRRMRRSKAEAV